MRSGMDPVGGNEPDTIAFGNTGIPSPFQRKLFEPNYDRWAQLHELAEKRTPCIQQAGIRRLINGPIPYSADADFVMGRVPELDNYFVATGFLYGIAAGGGAVFSVGTTRGILGVPGAGADGGGGAGAGVPYV